MFTTITSLCFYGIHSHVYTGFNFHHHELECLGPSPVLRYAACCTIYNFPAYPAGNKSGPGFFCSTNNGSNSHSQKFHFVKYIIPDQVRLLPISNVTLAFLSNLWPVTGNQMSLVVKAARCVQREGSRDLPQVLARTINANLNDRSLTIANGASCPNLFYPKRAVLFRRFTQAQKGIVKKLLNAAQD